MLRFTAPFDMSGSPSITLPGGFTAEGLPIGFQLVGRHLDEALLVRAATPTRARPTGTGGIRRSDLDRAAAHESMRLVHAMAQ